MLDLIYTGVELLKPLEELLHRSGVLGSVVASPTVVLLAI